MTQKKSSSGTIALNRRARYDYSIEQYFEAGISLQGWEVKSMRVGRVQVNDSYVILKQQEAWLVGSHITPLNTASTHVRVEPDRSRKLLLTARELLVLGAAVQRQGYTLVAIKLYWQKNWIKLSFGLAKGKKMHDKRMNVKEQDWLREKQRLARLSRHQN